jgi:hypothetical protein
MALSPPLVTAFAAGALAAGVLLGVFSVDVDDLQLDLVSPSSPTPPPPPRDPLVNASSSLPLRSMVKSKQPFRFKIRGCLSKIPLKASQKSPPPPGIRLQVSSIAGDEKLPHLSADWCNLLRQLGRFLFNRRKARSFHPAVLAIGDTSAHRRRVLLRWFLCCSGPGTFM